MTGAGYVFDVGKSIIVFERTFPIICPGKAEPCILSKPAQKPSHDATAWWCPEHAVPEAECSRCSEKVAFKCKKHGDWCEEHDRADSQCFVCHPELEAKFLPNELQRDYGFGKPDFQLYKPVGCDACGGTGYKGRVGLHELLVGSDAIKKQIQEHARVAEMLALSLQEGMLTLKMDGMEKVLQGVTDMAQVRAVCIK